MLISPDPAYLSFWLSHILKQTVTIQEVEKIRTGEKYILNLDNKFLIKQCLRDLDLPLLHREKKVLQALSYSECVPQVIHAENNLLVLEYINGEPLPFSTLEDLFIIISQLPNQGKLPKAEPYYLFSDAEYTFLKKFNTKLAEKVRSLRKDYRYEDVIHGDLKPANIIKDPQGNLKFIDWEYGGSGDRCWEMAMYYSEYLMSMNSWQEIHTLSPIDDLDLFLYLNPEIQRGLNLVRRYLGPEYPKFVQFLGVCILGKTVFRSKHKVSSIQSQYSYRLSSALLLDYHVSIL